MTAGFAGDAVDFIFVLDCAAVAEMRGVAVRKKPFVSCLSAGKWTARGRHEMKGGERSTMKVSN